MKEVIPGTGNEELRKYEGTQPRDLIMMKSVLEIMGDEVIRRSFS